MHLWCASPNCIMIHAFSRSTVTFANIADTAARSSRCLRLGSGVLLASGIDRLNDLLGDGQRLIDTEP